MNTISTYSPICSYAHNITAVEGNTMIYELLHLLLDLYTLIIQM